MKCLFIPLSNLCPLNHHSQGLLYLRGRNVTKKNYKLCLTSSIFANFTSEWKFVLNGCKDSRKKFINGIFEIFKVLVIMEEVVMKVKKKQFLAS